MSDQPIIPPALLGIPWTRRRRPLASYEEWEMYFGPLLVVLYRNVEPSSGGFGEWGATIGGEELELLEDSERAQSSKLEDVIEVASDVLCVVADQINEARGLETRPKAA